MSDIVYWINTREVSFSLKILRPGEFVVLQHVAVMRVNVLTTASVTLTIGSVTGGWTVPTGRTRPTVVSVK